MYTAYKARKIVMGSVACQDIFDLTPLIYAILRLVFPCRKLHDNMLETVFELICEIV